MVKIDEVDEKILQNISSNFISGQNLAVELNISRTAVWKRIQKLKELGYQIESSKNGYKLKKKTDFLLPIEIFHCLKTSFIGKNYIFFKEIDSTNDYSKRCKELEEGTVVLAETQTAGKGRKGRHWISSKGKGIYLSIVLKPKIPIKDILKFSLIFPLAVKEAVEEIINQEVCIKWPNDLYLNGNKFGGILTETEIEGNEVSRIIVGIGLNVNNDFSDFQDLENIATSLKLETGKEIDRKKLLCLILEQIEIKYGEYFIKKSEIINKINKSLLWKNQKVKLIDGNHEIEGELLKIDDTGGLVLKTGNGIQTIYSGDLSLRKV
jgi:BirA family biotin operon repressor/biotin-[acetyl-CoA-carboxylase] ligase